VTRPGPSQRIRVVEHDHERINGREDRLATEEPLEIRLGWPGHPADRLVVTMRTPGADFDLAAGFLFAEGLIGGSNLEDLASAGAHQVAPGPEYPADLVLTVPDLLRKQQDLFGRTGGLHAAGLVDDDGEAASVREDVGRHNAVDKVIGHRLLTGVGNSARLLGVSGRIGFEIVQKAVAADVAAIVAVGAPSSLAVDLAKKFGVTIVGFCRGRRFVVYAGEERIGAAN
jgi:FdhD protein